MPATRSVLIVEDEAALRATLGDFLTGTSEFSVCEADTIREAEVILGAQSPIEALILDIGLPDGDGRELCRRLRQQGSAMPILLLTGLGDEADVIHGLACGASDYIAKPFRLAELAARLRAQLRAMGGSETAAHVVGPYVFHPIRRRLSSRTHGHDIRLTVKEAAILKLLCCSDGQPVDRQILMQQVWGSVVPATVHRLEMHIHRLRQKIERDPRRPDLLVTLSGGYQLGQAPN